jgi:hypothetical protein
MGGDGGVIASNRRYMRHAGTADGTGDPSTTDSLDPAWAIEEQRRRLYTCAVSGQPLAFGSSSIVACQQGYLYHKEAAIEALLRRRHQQQSTTESSSNSSALLGEHVRKLKDLYDARFHAVENRQGDKVPACPITGEILTGHLPVVMLVPGRAGQVNVLSEKGMKEMGLENVTTEYGPIQQKIRLAPDAAYLKQLQQQVAEPSKRKSKHDAAAVKGKKHKKT